METAARTQITVKSTINAPINIVWANWNEPTHIIQWCHASDDWCAPSAENDLRRGGRFKTVMAAKDGSFSFDFGGTYTNVDLNKTIEYIIDDSRAVKIEFISNGNETTVVETFEAEEQHSPEMQRAGWQAILDNFKRYTESR